MNNPDGLTDAQRGQLHRDAIEHRTHHDEAEP